MEQGTDTWWETDPWKIWPDGIVPAEGNRPAFRLLTKEEGRAWLEELDEIRKRNKLPPGVSSLDLIREERDER
jgi:hypothetical protein